MKKQRKASKSYKPLKPPEVNRYITEIEPDIEGMVYTSIIFADQKILAFILPNGIYVSVQSLTDNLGIDYGSQARKIREDEDNKYKGSMLRFRDSYGTKRNYLCVDIGMLAYWLMTVNTKKVNDSVKEAIHEYQEACSISAGETYFKHA